MAKRDLRTTLLLSMIGLIFLTFNFTPYARAIPVADGFDFPVGKPDGVGYKHGELPGGDDGWDFLEWNEKVWHPGEDWNKRSGGNSDLGAPVYAVANGLVIHSGSYGPGWGNIIVIKHQLPNGTYVWSQYAHLKDRMVVPGWEVTRGRQIGTIGKGYNNEYSAHLHFEIRKTDLAANYWPVGETKTQVTEKYYRPSTFIKANRSTAITGFASVSSGVMVSPSSVTVDGDYNVTFTLKETKGAAITFDEIACLIRDANSNDLFYLGDKASNVTISANGVWTYAGHGWAVGKLATPGTYKAVARGRVGSTWFPFKEGGGTNPAKFQVVQKALPPTLVAPSNNSHQTSRITFRWNSVSGASKYKLFVKLTDSSSWVSTEISATSYDYPPGTLGQYRWKVQAYVNGKWSADSSEWVFFFDGLPAPTLISPANVSQVDAVRPTFRWNTVADAQTYELQLFRNASPADIVRDLLSTPGTSWQLDNQDLSRGQTYYWRVRTASPIGQWSSAWQFRVKPLKYTLQVQVSPPNAGVVAPSGGTYDAGTQVTLRATPNAGWEFDNWSGALSGSTNPLALTMNGNKTVTAYFRLVPTRIIRLAGDLSFKDVEINTSVQKTLTIHNDGNSPLSVSSIVYPAGFSGNWSSGDIPKNGSQNVTVTFSPTEARDYSGTVTVNSNKTSGTHTIAVSGRGVPLPTRILRLAGDLTFGEVEVNGSAQRTLTIHNDGNATLSVSSIVYPAGFSGNWSSGDIPKNGNQNVTVTFSPTEVRDYSGTITVNSNKTSGTHTISVTGRGASHAVTITAGPTATPSRVPSEGLISLSVTASDSQGHAVNYAWSVNPAEGTFNDEQVPSPTWTAPENCTGSDVTYTFTVVVTCSVDPGVTATATTQVIVESKPHTITMTKPTATPSAPPLSSAGGPVALSVEVADSCEHAVTYVWSATPQAGDFSNTSIATPIWTAPANNTGADITYTLTVTATCSVDTSVSQTANVQVIVPGGLPAVIKPVAASPQQAGSEFDVAIQIEDVTNLFGASLVLHYDTAYLDEISARKGDLLGNDVVSLDPAIDDGAGTVSLGITRKRPAGGVDGDGVLVSVRFQSLPSIPDGTSVEFTITDIAANGPNGGSIRLEPESLTVQFIQLAVWPGDTNDDGAVNQADVLPLGLHWTCTGPARQNPSLVWKGQPAQPWTPETATYADANGDGTVDQADVLPIGVNWGLTHHAGALASPSTFPHSARDSQALIRPILVADPRDGHVTVQIEVEQAVDLFGAAFLLRYPSEWIPSDVAVGDLLGRDVISYHKVDALRNAVHMGLTRTRPQVGVSGRGILVRVSFEGNSERIPGSLALSNIRATSSTGVTIPLRIGAWRLSEERMSASFPARSALLQNFPNPFNPETWIPFQLAANMEVTISIYDGAGSLVRAMPLGEKAAGFYTSRESAVYWDGRNGDGESVASGVYFYQVQAGTFRATRRMIITR